MKRFFLFSFVLIIFSSCNSSLLSNDDELLLKAKLMSKDAKVDDVTKCLGNFMELKPESKEGDIVKATVKMQPTYILAAMLGGVKTIQTKGCDEFKKELESNTPKKDLEAFETVRVEYDVKNQIVKSQKKI